MAQTIR
jgi:hypothetical protein